MTYSRILYHRTGKQTSGSRAPPGCVAPWCKPSLPWNSVGREASLCCHAFSSCGCRDRWQTWRIRHTHHSTQCCTRQVDEHVPGAMLQRQRSTRDDMPIRRPLNAEARSYRHCHSTLGAWTLRMSETAWMSGCRCDMGHQWKKEYISITYVVHIF